MDFALRDTSEQAAFREEIRRWLAQNMPPGMEMPADPATMGEELYRKQRELGRRLGQKGWLCPTYPKEYGGGGFSVDEARIIEEELDRVGQGLPPYYDSGIHLAAPCIMVWGTGEQKKRFLPPMCKGLVRTWQFLTEPGAGSDLANVRTTAIRDGDHYVVNGTKVFVGTKFGADYAWCLFCTDPQGERHKNLSWFLVPVDLPGITVMPMELLSSGGEGSTGSGVKQTVYLENVRVPAANLVGGEGNGWKVATTHLEFEHGAIGSIKKNRVVEGLLQYCRAAQRQGRPLINDPEVQERLVDIFVDAEVSRLFGMRKFWLGHAKKQVSYEGSQLYLHDKLSGLRMANAILDIVGPYALTTDPQLALLANSLEYHQRSTITMVTPGGTSDIHKVIIARRIGIGRSSQEESGRLA